MMAERTHPNREGQGAIAAGIADWLEQQDAFRRFLARTGG
jgi:lysophospholipase L1-like esterase